MHSQLNAYSSAKVYFYIIYLIVSVHATLKYMILASVHSS